MLKPFRFAPVAALRGVMLSSLLLAVMLVGAARPASAINIVRDAEIEALIEEMAAPIFAAAGLSTEEVDIYLVNDPGLNAFVMGGANLFLNAGLLMRTEQPEELLGVIAHETGHIAGGHLSRLGGAGRRAGLETALSAVLGAAAAAATGSPDLATAIIAGGQGLAASGFLRFTRVQEQAADQAALSYLQRAGVSAEGLYEVLNTLEQQSFLSGGNAAEYLQTHPLTRSRLETVRAHLARNVSDNSGINPDWPARYTRARMKVKGFLQQPQRVLAEVAEQDGFAAHYAEAVVYHRMGDADRALTVLRGLLADQPDDPYLHELHGQIAFEHGRVELAATSYQRALDLAPDATLIRFALGHSLIELGGAANQRRAITHLERALEDEPENSLAWRLLATAYAQQDRQAEANVALAEYALRQGRTDDARRYLHRVTEQFNKNSPMWLRAQDLRHILAQQESD